MRVLIIFCFIILCSCTQKNWTKRGYEKGWIKSDTIIDTVYTKQDSKDTIFKHFMHRDTVFLKENKLTVKYFYNNSDSTVYLSGNCDPDTIRVPKIINTISTEDQPWYSDWPYWLAIVFLLVMSWLIAKS